MRRSKPAAAILFLLLFSLILMCSYNVLSFKYGDGILGLKYLYKLEENSVDVLILGSSHAFEDVNTQVLFDDYGIAGYVLAGSVQPFWNSYYYLKEALKTQTPKLVLLEGFAAAQSFQYSDYSRIIKNNLGIRDLRNRIESISVSSPEDDRENYFLNYRLWHSRYDSIDESDFPSYYERPKFQNYTGFGTNYNTVPYDEPDTASFTGEERILEKEEQYFRKIIELCKQNEISVLVFVSPFIVSEQEQKCFNYLQSLSSELGVDFINFNAQLLYETMRLDFRKDFADRDHLNHLGNVKFTRLLAKAVQGYTDLPDRRTDPSYHYWQMNSRYLVGEVEDFRRSVSTSPEELLQLISSDQDLLLFIYTCTQTDRIHTQTDLFETLGFREIFPLDGNLYRLENGIARQVSDSSFQWKFDEEIDGRYIHSEYCLRLHMGENAISRSFWCDGSQLLQEGKGCYIFIFNRFTKTPVCCKQLYLDPSGTFQIKTISKSV